MGKLAASRIVTCLSFVAAASLGGCGKDPPDLTEPPNTFVTATVNEIKVETTRSKLLGEMSKSYAMKLTDTSGQSWHGGIISSWVKEDDLREIIGRSVSFSCWREPAYGRTCHVVRSLTYAGRELIRPAK